LLAEAVVERPSLQEAPRIIGRYALYGKIASGGMATVHYGRLLGPIGFSRTVAIKRLHPHLTADAEFVSMFLDEARLAARIRHPNVVQTLDIVATEGEFFLVMDYVEGVTLGRLLRRVAVGRETLPLPVLAAIFSGILHGLHAAHEAKNEHGEPLEVIHRDISPQNIILGLDGVARLLDFGVAKATGRLQVTREGQIKGKIAYMAPEQLHGIPATRQSDVYALSVVLWETLTGRRLFQDGKDGSEQAVLQRVLAGDVPGPSTLVPGLPSELDAIVEKGLRRDPRDRYATAREMASALESILPVAIRCTWVSGWRRPRGSISPTRRHVSRRSRAGRIHRGSRASGRSGHRIRPSGPASAKDMTTTPSRWPWCRRPTSRRTPPP
jgi:serine/threonine protein kinase